MKRSLFVAILVLLVGITTVYAQKPNAKKRVEVVYFHGKQRCITCRAIEKNAKELVEQDFAKQVKQGKVVFKTVDISTKEGEALANRYRVTWSSLFVNNWKAGKEVSNNLTEMAFKNARTNPEGFKKQLKAQINAALK